MIESFDRKEEFLALLDEDISSIISKCKFLFIENRNLYVSMANLSDEEISYLRSNWVKKVKNALAIMEIDWKAVSVEEEKLLFIEKALEIMKAKEVKISLA